MDNEKETKKHEVGDLLTCRNSTLLPSISLNMLSSLKRSNTKLRVVDRGKEQTNRLYFTQNALNSLIANASNTREHFVIYNNIVDTMNQIKKQFNNAKFFSITLEISKFMINLHCDFQNYNDAFTELLALVCI
jgi:phosphoribosyl-dephospho-CoA transferase